MTQHINADWKPHVAATGVTCYTCHRGKRGAGARCGSSPQPQDLKSNFIGDRAGQNAAGEDGRAELAALRPVHAATCWATQTIGVGAARPRCPPGTSASIVQTEQTYGLMMHMCEGLGVNCTFCHNTRNFKTWEGAPPQRATAWHGIRMARDLNNDYLVPLTQDLPGQPPGADRRCRQGQLRHLPPGRLQAAVRRADGQGLPRSCWRWAGPRPTDGLPAPQADAARSVLFFAVGSAALDAEQAKGLLLLMATLVGAAACQGGDLGLPLGQRRPGRQPGPGQAARLQRARCLLAAGVAPARVKLDKPLQAEANLAGEDPAARRVEVTLQ